MRLGQGAGVHLRGTVGEAVQGKSFQSLQSAVISRMEAMLGNLKRASSLLIHVTKRGGTEGRRTAGLPQEAQGESILPNPPEHCSVGAERIQPSPSSDSLWETWLGDFRVGVSAS